MVKMWFLKIIYKPVYMKKIINRLRVLILLTLLPLLVSCTPGFLYNNLDRISLWYIDDYVTLTSEQQTTYTQQFNELQRWHREYELKNYQHLLSSINQQIGSETLSRQEILQAVTDYHQEARNLWVNLVAKVSPHLYEPVRQLSDQQKNELIHNLSAKNQRHYEKKQALSEEEWQQDKIKRLKKNISRWIGSFTPEQEHEIQQWANNLNSLDQNHYAFRKQWLDQLASVLNQPELASKNSLEQLLANHEAFMNPSYRQQLEANRTLTEELIANLLIARTTKQQKTLVREINDWLELIGKVIQS